MSTRGAAAFCKFLALLDYVSRAHESEIRPSYVVRRTSVVRLWHRLSLKLLHGLHGEKNFFFWFFRIFFSFSLTWDPIGAKPSKRYSSLKSLLKTFSEISSQWSWQKYCFGFLKFWVFDFSGILFVLFNMGPYGSQNFKTLLLPQITFESFQPFPEFSSQWSSQKYRFGFLKF